MINRNSVIIKTNAYGLILILNPDMPFEDLLKDVGEKFSEAARFFRNAQMALTFRGRVLTHSEECRLIYTITENSSIHIVCLVDERQEEEEFYKEAVTRQLEADEEQQFWVHYGTVSRGQVLDIPKSVIVFGDVNPGAEVISTGSVIVMGCCMGTVRVGAAGRAGCFLAAMVLKPKDAFVEGHHAYTGISKRENTGEYAMDPKIMYVKDEKLKIEPVGSRAFSDLMRREKFESDNPEEA